MPAFAVSFMMMLAAGATGAGDAGEVHGSVRTSAGETLTGTIRWGEARPSWDETFDARKPQRPPSDDAEEGFRFSLFGWNLAPPAGETASRYLSVPFGHLRSLEADRDGAWLELKGGERLRVEGRTRDLGSRIELRVHDEKRGEVGVPWRRVARVNFSSGPGSPREADRLYGTVTTTAGELTGFIVWDRDEARSDDVLDGEEDGKDLELRFEQIAAIEPAGRSAARVRLVSGAEHVLGGTNDVNADNRGVVVRVDGVGTVTVDWEHLVRVSFSAPPRSPAYDAFDGGRRISGRVRTRAGAVHEGRITWDLDEAYSWERIEGEAEGLDYSVPFDQVRSIRPSGRGAEIGLSGGRTLLLRGTNDVDSDNAGIVVEAADGSEVILSWEEIAEVRLDPAAPPQKP